MILIWGFRGGADTTDQEKQRRSKILIGQLEEEKATIIVPTVSIAELVVPVPSKGKFIAEFQKRFACPPFDLRAAALAAELWQKHRKLPKSKQIKRSTLKSDVMIVATAKVAGATIFYSNDTKLRKLAELAGLVARDLPTHDENMFRDAET